MRLYVIGPVTGREKLNREAFEDAKERLWDAGYDVLIPHDVVLPIAPHERAMRLSIKAMLGCDGVAALTDWDESRGAKLEREVAVACGIEIHCVDTWLLMADDSPKNDNSPKGTPNPPSPPSDGVTAPSNEALSALTRRIDETNALLRAMFTQLEVVTALSSALTLASCEGRKAMMDRAELAAREAAALYESAGKENQDGRA